MAQTSVQHDVKSSASLPPGPKGYPVIGVLPQFVSSTWLDFMTRWAREYGDLVHMNLLGTPMCYINRPEYIKLALVTHAGSFHKSRGYSVVLRRMLGEGLVTSEDATWRQARRIYMPAFKREQVNIFATLAVKHASAMRDTWRDGQERDVQVDMAAITLQVAAEAFGLDLGDDVPGIGAALNAAMEEFASVSNYLLPDWLPTASMRRFRKAVAQFDAVVERIIERKRANPGDGSDLLAMLMKAHDDGVLSARQLRDEIKTTIVSGHETTANTLSWTWHLLSLNPPVHQRLRTEIAQVCGQRQPEQADLARMPYLRKVFKEAMRVYPTAYTIGRKTIEAFRMGEYVLPAGTTVIMAPWVVHHNAAYYPDPEQFNPDRWTPEFEAQLPEYAYFPFGGGARGCIGESFAMAEAGLIITILAQKFALTPMPGRVVTPLPAITLRPKEGVWVTVHQAETLHAHADPAPAAGCPYHADQAAA